MRQWGVGFAAGAFGLGGLSVPSAQSALATETFTAPDWTSTVCKEFTQAFPGGNAVAGLTPDMVANVVGVPVPVQGTPASQTLVVVELGQRADQSVVRTFLERCGLEPATWTQLRPDGEPNPNPGSEATLDLTVVAGLLPQNTTLKTATVADGDFVDALLNAAHACGLEGDTPSTWSRAQLDTPSGGCIVSMSYAVFEKSVSSYLDGLGFNTPQLQTEYLQAADGILSGMASSGVITLVSSGDEGSGGCQPSTRGIRDQMAPQWPSTSPHVLSIGGTMWAPPDWNGAPITPTNYIPGTSFQPVAWRTWELGSDCFWDASADEVWPGVGTTGGESGADFYARPAYQDGVASAVPGSTGRLSPDVSALAGWPTWLVPQVNDGSAYSYEMGTSAAAPLTAVGLAHVNAALTARGLSPMDNAGGNLDVHNIFYNPAFASALNDVTEGSNNLWSSDIWSGPTAVEDPADLQGGSSPFLDGNGDPLGNTSATITGNTAKVGYDLTTGMGVPNFSTLAALLIEAQTVTYDPQGPDPVLQQVPVPDSGSCADVDDSRYNWGGAGSGGWAQSWAQWADAGRGGPVCTRTLIYNASFGIWVVQR